MITSYALVVAAAVLVMSAMKALTVLIARRMISAQTRRGIDAAREHPSVVKRASDIAKNAGLADIVSVRIVDDLRAEAAVVRTRAGVTILLQRKYLDGPRWLGDALLAHEIAHVKAGHAKYPSFLPTRLDVAWMLGFVTLLLLSVPAWIAYALLVPTLFADFAWSRYRRRKQELEADMLASTLLHNGQSMMLAALLVWARREGAGHRPWLKRLIAASPMSIESFERLSSVASDEQLVMNIFWLQAAEVLSTSEVAEITTERLAEHFGEVIEGYRRDHPGVLTALTF